MKRIAREMRRRPKKDGYDANTVIVDELNRREEETMILKTNVCMKDNDDCERVMQTLEGEGWVEEPGHRIVFEIGQDEYCVSADFYREI